MTPWPSTRFQPRQYFQCVIRDDSTQQHKWEI